MLRSRLDRVALSYLNIHEINDKSEMDERVP